MEEYQNIDTIFENAENIKNKRVSKGLISAREYYKTSLELVTIDINVPLDISIKSLKRIPINSSELIKLIENFELYSLKKQLDGTVNQKYINKEFKKTKKKYQLVTSNNQLKEICVKLKSVKLISIDTETTSKDPHQAELVGISFSFKENNGFYIPILGLEKQKLLNLKSIKKIFGPILADFSIKKCGQNIKYDAIVLNNAGIELNGIYFDTMVAAHIINPISHEYKLDLLAKQYLGYSMMPIENLIGEGKNQITMDLVEVEKSKFYAAEDADITFSLVNKFKLLVEKDEIVEYFYNIDIQLIPVLVEMEKHGVYIDCNFLKKLSNELKIKLQQSISDIYDMVGRNFNINSPKQLAEVLFDELELENIRKRSTDVKVLEILKNYHPLPQKVLNYRSYKKLNCLSLNKR